MMTIAGTSSNDNYLAEQQTGVIKKHSARQNCARPSRQRRLISANTVQNSHSNQAESASRKNVFSLADHQEGEDVGSLVTIILPPPTSSKIRKETLSKERVAYDEKADTGRSPRKVAIRTIASRKTYISEDDTAYFDDETEDDSLSDFIVNDSASESELRKPPRSMRKMKLDMLNKTPRNGRRTVVDSEDEQEEYASRHVNPKCLTDALKELNLSTINTKIAIDVPGRIKRAPNTNANSSVPDSSTRKASATTALKTLEFHTPPTSPTKPKLQSPSKQRIVIPKSPHRPSMDAFWKQETINQWNDVYSPQKTQKVKKFFDFGDKDTDLLPLESSRRSPLMSPAKSPAKRDKIAIERKRDFNARKINLANHFLQELDQVVTSGQLSALSDSTGGVNIVWSKTLKSTAGRAKWQREAVRTTESTGKTSTTKTIWHHKASIELAEKVIDDEDRLLNVLAHEFCHLANFMISNIKDQPHGKSFREWAAKVTARFPHKNICVTTKHTYTIDYKYVWGCTDCGVEYKRHSKSIDPIRHTCGACKGKLVQVKPVPRTARTNDTARKTSTITNPYQAYVKKWYVLVKEEHPGWKMGEIMSELSTRYKLEKSTTAGVSFKKIDINEDVATIDEVEAIAISDHEDVTNDGITCLGKQLSTLAVN